MSLYIRPELVCHQEDTQDPTQVAEILFDTDLREFHRQRMEDVELESGKI